MIILNDSDRQSLLVLHKILFLLVGEGHEENGEHAGADEEDEGPVPASRLSDVADNDIGRPAEPYRARSP